MPTAPNLVAHAVVTGTGNSRTTPTLTLAAGDVVTVLGIGEGAAPGNSWLTPTTTLTVSGSITQLQLHASSSDCQGGAWTFTVGSGTTTGTVTLQLSSGASGNAAMTTFVHRSGTAATAARSALSTGTGRTVSYTPSQADSAIAWALGDWAAGSVQTQTPTPTSHSSASPGPSATPQSGTVAGAYTQYSAVLDDQTSTGATSYGIGGTGTGPFTILVVEIQGTGGGGGGGTLPELIMPTIRRL